MALLPQLLVASAFSIGFVLIGLLIIIPTVFWILMLVDAAKRNFENPNDKTIWILVLVFTHILGAIIYYFVVKAKAPKDETHEGLSPETKSAITLVLLLMTPFFGLFGLAGLILMWFWTSWPKWVKILVTLPAIIIPLAFFGLFGILLNKPKVQPSQAPTNQRVVLSPSRHFTKENIEEIITDINNERTAKNLKTLVIDEKLCGFANKRVIEFQEAQTSDKLPNIKSELQDPVNKAAYFTGFSYVVVKDVGTTEDDLEKIALKYTAPPESTALKPNLTHACFTALESSDEAKWLTVFVGGTHR